MGPWTAFWDQRFLSTCQLQVDAVFYHMCLLIGYSNM